MRASAGFRRRRLTKCSIVLLLAQISFSYVVMNWNDTHYFGPDGPWQAVVVQVGSSNVNLLPAGGGAFSSSILTSDVCAGEDSDNCGIGGFLNDTPPISYPIAPQDNSSPEAAPIPISAGNFSWSLIGNATWSWMSLEPLTEALLNPSWNATVSAVYNSMITYPSGKVKEPELGIFNMGGDPTAIEANPDPCRDSSCDPVTYLYNNGQLASRSWSLHLGCASLSFPGSLILGGYDKGRAIGPTVNIASEVQLSDIVLGVETGMSPFSFDSRAGFLQEKTGVVATQPLDMSISPIVPYIFLPQPTIDAIVSELPVYFDTSSKFYLWNVTDPRYIDVVSSPSYLGFVFIGDTNTNVTIKVPFLQLNLTLESTISGLDHAVQYLPVQPALNVGGISPYALGRAFLQSAFVAANYINPRVAWLAQAPGPGVSNRGLGYEVRNLTATSTTFEIYPGDQGFWAESWASVWTPLAAPKPETTPKTPSNTARPTAHGRALSRGAEAGIAVGVVVASIAVLTGGLLAFRRRRASAGPTKSSVGSEDKYEKPELDATHRSSQASIEIPEDQIHEMEQSSIPELHGAQMLEAPQSWPELPTKGDDVELMAVHGMSEVDGVERQKLNHESEGDQ